MWIVIFVKVCFLYILKDILFFLLVRVISSRFSCQFVSASNMKIMFGCRLFKELHNTHSSVIIQIFFIYRERKSLESFSPELVVRKSHRFLLSYFSISDIFIQGHAPLFTLPETSSSSFTVISNLMWFFEFHSSLFCNNFLLCSIYCVFNDIRDKLICLLINILLT